MGDLRGAETMTLSDAQKERIKLRATFVNNLGVGIILVGVFTPVTRAVYDQGVALDHAALVALSSVICLLTGVARHYGSSWYVLRLDR